MSGRRAALLSFALGLLFTRAASADLGEDVQRLRAAWRRQGEVRVLPPRLGERSAPTVVFLPAEAVAPAGRPCTSVVVMGPNSTHFTVRAIAGGPLPEALDDWPQASLAGLVQLTRCGRSRARLAALVVEMRSPRAVLETLVVASAEPVRPAVEVLPQRDPGPIAPLAPSGPRPEAPPIAERLAAVDARARRDQALDVQQRSTESSPRGAGVVRDDVGPGCHRFDLLAEPAKDGDPAYDFMVAPELDANASLVSVERGDGLDASVTLCAGEPSHVEIQFGGAPSRSRVWTVRSSFAFPAGLPESWGALGRARIAAVLRRHGARVTGGPIDQALGVQGPTLMPLRAEPGACYVAALAAVRGEPLALALAATGREFSAQNHGGPRGDSTLVSFCAHADGGALIEADTRGAGLVWLFALFQTGRIAVGTERSE